MNKRNHATKLALITALAVMLQGQAIAQQTSAGMAAVQEAEEYRSNLQASEAEAAYQRAIALSPEDPNVLAAYASFLRQMGNNAEAIRLLRWADRLNAADQDADVEIQDQLARTYLYLKDYDAAATLRRQQIIDNPDFPITHLELGYSEINRENYEEALRHLQIAEQIFGNELNGYRSAQLAIAYANLGRRDDVLRLFERLRGLSNVSQAAWAGHYIALGDYPQALEHLEAATGDSASETRPLLSFIAGNHFSDPALENEDFQELFARLRPQ